MYNLFAGHRTYICTADNNNPKQHTHSAMIEISADTYRLVAAYLREEIASSDWFNGTVRGIFPADGSSESAADPAEWSLTLTAIVYRRCEMFPEGVRRPISDIVPVWWVFRIDDCGEECLNNFSFNQLKPYLIDYE
jgi:hypothetical protein